MGKGGAGGTGGTGGTGVTGGAGTGAGDRLLERSRVLRAYSTRVDRLRCCCWQRSTLRAAVN
jgi:hypothetical protein